jgi:hypothetical protein
MKRLLPAIVALLALAQPAAADMKLSFTWGAIPSCTNGRPNTVANPEFTLGGVPAGTTRIDFRLTDLDVPSYNHGGGKVKMTGSGKVPSGLFKYKSPCPPGAVHTYQWTATAKAGNKTLATAIARRKYPE